LVRQRRWLPQQKKIARHRAPRQRTENQSFSDQRISDQSNGSELNTLKPKRS
jgi:hypothetical protein